MEIAEKNSGSGANMKAGLTPEDPALDEIVRRLVASYQPLEVYLFGSKARGDSGPDSDYDLLVVVPNDAPPGAEAKPAGLRGPAGHRLGRGCARLHAFLLRASPVPQSFLPRDGNARREAAARRLTRLARRPRFRYLGEPSEPSREEAREALDTAREVLEVLARRVPKDVQP
jgi:hypothetical protein